MPTLAIIGTGISGLGCAHFLQHRYQLTLYEKSDYVGGHSNTVRVDDGERQVSIDTGFMTYNEVTYPNLTRLFRELGVASRASSMSFSVQHLPARLEFSGSSLNHLFGQRRNLFRPQFWKHAAADQSLQPVKPWRRSNRRPPGRRAWTSTSASATTASSS
jgi:predicted NAD/FAD-binding protein